MRCFACALVLVVTASLFIASPAFAGESGIASDESTQSWIEDLDFRGPVRLGTGYSKIFHGPVTSMSFEDEISIFHLGKHARFHIVFGMDGYSAGDLFATDPDRPSFFTSTVGAGVNFRIGRPLFVSQVTTGPGWSNTNGGLLPDGIGVSARVEVFPLYLPMQEAIECKSGWVSSYVLSGLSVWGEARQDYFGSKSGSMLAVGGGIDLGRNVLLPILHQVFSGHCGV